MSAAGRPKEQPLKMGGKFTYTRLGEKLICFPSECALKDEEDLIKCINSAYDKGTCMYLTTEQHERIIRLLEHMVVGSQSWR